MKMFLNFTNKDNKNDGMKDSVKWIVVKKKNMKNSIVKFPMH